MEHRLVTKLIGFMNMTVLALAAVTAATLPYDESANAKLALQTALTDAQRQHKHVLVIFGANWCPDCRALDKALQGDVGKLVDSRFVVVKIDVGNFDKNLDLSERYGNPTKKGIPAAVVLAAGDNMLYSTHAGELANARRMSETGIYEFFSKIIDGHP